ncbi:unnamed protein product [Prorocentrum cordatum]|uniref:PPM-type phosphatase domain-containing protein n=1 Tax=Prorocentrum cordatum TaxID=2364126 RepID=A0ABN9WUQ2_9DINO|nr:unnamed protein product [Polarella glacialis]
MEGRRRRRRGWACAFGPPPGVSQEILGLAERKKFEAQGSTALVALLHGNPKLGTPLRLILAHVGDSRAVLCRAGQAVAVSEDHKPDRLDEKKRIERAGGLVLNVRGAWRIAAPTNPRGGSKASRREYQGLAMTRSLGDLCFKQPTALSSAEPEVKVMPITEQDSFLILATDGIYNVLSNQDVVDCAGKHWNDPEEAAKNVVRSAFQKGSDENLTALVIQFGARRRDRAPRAERRRRRRRRRHCRRRRPRRRRRCCLRHSCRRRRRSRCRRRVGGHEHAEVYREEEGHEGQGPGRGQPDAEAVGRP